MMRSRPPKTLREGLRLAAETPLAQLAARLPGTAGATPVDSIHDARVALRRLGALLRAAAEVHPAREIAALKREMRWMRHVLGPARDLDVFIQQTAPLLTSAFPGEPGLDALAAVAAQKRAALADQIGAAVTSARATRLLEDLRRIFGLGAPPAASPRGKPVSAAPAARKETAEQAAASLDDPFLPFARQFIHRRYRKIRKAGKSLGTLSDDDLHQLRIRLRTLRYLCDGFRTALPEQRYAVFRRAVQDMQDGLGAINDAITTPALIRDLAAALPLDEPPTRAINLVAGWGAGRRHVLREGLDEPWRRMVKRGDRMFEAIGA